jgi:signal transduction histidine kinase/DNA-binding response OmpR family regulator/CHASE3 domain sensor protein
MPLSLSNRINVLIGFALVVLAIVGIVSYHNVTRLDESAHWVTHTHEVLATLESLMANVNDAKSSQRGYVITGSGNYLSSYSAVKENILKKVSDVRQLTSDNPNQQKRIEALTPLIIARVAIMDHTISVRREQGFGAAADIFATSPGKYLADEIQKLISEMEQEEYILLKEREAVATSGVRSTKFTILLGSLLAFSLVPLAALIINREIQKRSDAERRLLSKTEELAGSERESRRKSQILQSILNSMGDGVAVANEKGEFILFNSAAERILGVGSIPIPRQGWTEHFGIYLADGVTPVSADDIPLARALRGESVEDAELFVRNPKIPDGVWINVTANPLTDEGSVRRGGVAVFRDISRNKQAEELLVRAKDEAERASNFKDQFLSTMSHELRTPLNAVLGFSDLLADERYGSLNDRQRRYVNNIHTGGEHLLRLISDILDLSKIQAGRMDLTIQDVPVKLAFAEVLTELGPLADKKSQTLSQSESASDLIVRADVTRFRQMLMNLTGNAIKFTPQGGDIELAAKIENGQIRIEVLNSGPGIPAEEQQRIFSSFYRLKQTGEPIEGTGLGLAITQRLAELHGSRLELESQPGQGSCFYFSLPAGTLVQAPQKLGAGHKLSKGGTPKILVIEDDCHAAQLIQSYLASCGYESVYCDQPQNAMNIVATLQPDVITLDLLMNPSSGWEVLLQLKNDPRTASIPVVVISIVDQPAIGTTFGADEYLVKPVDKSALLAAVGRCLSSGVSSGRSSSHRPLLVVEDDPATREVIAELLTTQGYTVTLAEDGEQARAHVAATLPELVILDLILPKVSGLELLAEWRANPRTADLPVFVLTSKDLSGEEEQYLRKHAESLFHKQQPWQEALTNQLQRALKNTPSTVRS